MIFAYYVAHPEVRSGDAQYRHQHQSQQTSTGRALYSPGRVIMCSVPWWLQFCQPPTYQRCHQQPTWCRKQAAGVVVLEQVQFCGSTYSHGVTEQTGSTHWDVCHTTARPGEPHDRSEPHLPATSYPPSTRESSLEPSPDQVSCSAASVR